MSTKMKRHLPVKLTDEEKRNLGRDLAVQELERKNHVDAFSVVNSDFKKKLNLFGKSIIGLSKVLDEGAQERPVECEERRNLDANLFEVVRLDTNEVIESRALTAEERQADLFDETVANEKQEKEPLRAKPRVKNSQVTEA